MPLYNRNTVIVQDESVFQGNASTLNFVGAGVTTSVVSATATVTIPGGGGGATATRAVIALSYPTSHSQTATLTDAAISATSKVNAWLSGLADSNVNSNMEPALTIKAFAGTGSALLQFESNTPIGGNISIDYMVLA